MFLKKQVGGLQEDNDRINRMYQVVEKEIFNSMSANSKGPASANEEKSEMD